MTLIASIQIDGCPILLGDLLLSGPAIDTNKFSFPTKTALDIPPRVSGKLEPDGLCQKANLLSPKLAIAWSGNKDEAVSFFSQVIGAGIQNDPSKEKIYEIYADLDNPDELSVIGMLKNSSATETFGINAERLSFPNPLAQNVIVEGSGKKGLVDLLNRSDGVLSSGTSSKLELAIGKTIGIISGLFSSEIATSETLQECYGAGYEIIYPLGDHLEKFSDLTYVLWKINVKNGSIIGDVAPFFAMKYSYFDDLLTIRSVHIADNKLVDDALHIIQPIFSNQHIEDFSKLSPSSLNSKYICSIFETNLNGKPYCYSQIGRFVTVQRPIIFYDNNRSDFGIDVDQRFYRDSINKFIQGMHL